MAGLSGLLAEPNVFHSVTRLARASLQEQNGCARLYTKSPLHVGDFGAKVHRGDEAMYIV